MKSFIFAILLISISFSTFLVSLNYDGSACLYDIPKNFQIPSNIYDNDSSHFCTQSFTFKNGATWELSIPNYTGQIQVQLPLGAKVLDTNLNIYNKDNILYADGNVKNPQVTYTLYPTETDSSLYMWVGLIIIIGAGAWYFFIKNKSKKNQKINKKQVNTEQKSDKPKKIIHSKNISKLDLLPDTEKKVVAYLMKAGPMSQRELEAGLSMPKSTLSRTLKTLEFKNIVIRKKIGLTKKVILSSEWLED